MLKISRTTLLTVVLTLGVVTVQAMEMDNAADFTLPSVPNGGPKAFHFLSTLFVLLILQSFATVLTFAERQHSASFLQCVTLGYAVFEALFLRFPDADGVENRTSRGTAWFLLILNSVTVFFALLNSSSSFLLSSEGKPGLKWIARLSERGLKRIHKTLAFLLVLTGWVKTCLAPVALFGFCRDVHLGQCLAHGIMGSSFIIYGFVYALVLVLPHFRENPNHNQDWYDSCLMTAYGVVNTFTEHRFGQEWSHSDFQHTSMGIIWWCGGMLGLFFTRNGERSWIPSMLIMFTGWAMSEHSQQLMISTKIHYVFGLSLMLGALCRIIEISVLLKDERNAGRGKIYTFQYLSPFFLILAGVLFMGANEQQLELVVALGSDHGAYTLTITSCAFLILLWILVLLEVYQRLTYRSGDAAVFGENSKYQDLRQDDSGANGSTEFELDNFQD
ncbi:hypothetical protein WICPIJ_008000 [Wickerhamomyces pijperi]|uniref:Protein YTP1-like C-terminal domain-containing protein n=1 Tax=Wickerhamomyces pijperi TaxID=599730 RepID=A0A9P8PZE4_WICPI|nr:hypothetical protein WICPIJ_008000 [Wickerhamomyces pijperi]